MIVYILSRIFKKLRLASVKDSYISFKSKVESGSLFYNSYMDDFSFCGYDCEIINTRIGKYCSIANNVIIGAAQHPLDWVSTSPVFYKGRDSVSKKFAEHDLPQSLTTIIGNDVWIGHSVLIKQGVQIGDGAVIAMGSVVTKDVPAYAIVGGVPSKVIRYRFNVETIKKLEEIRWWDFPEEKLISVAKSFNNLELFLNPCSNESDI